MAVRDLQFCWSRAAVFHSVDNEINIFVFKRMNGVNGLKKSFLNIRSNVTIYLLPPRYFDLKPYAERLD